MNTRKPLNLAIIAVVLIMAAVWGAGQVANAQATITSITVNCGSVATAVGVVGQLTGVGGTITGSDFSLSCGSIGSGSTSTNTFTYASSIGIPGVTGASFSFLDSTGAGNGGETTACALIGTSTPAFAANTPFGLKSPSVLKACTVGAGADVFSNPTQNDPQIIFFTSGGSVTQQSLLATFDNASLTLPTGTTPAQTAGATISLVSGVPSNTVTQIGITGVSVLFGSDTGASFSAPGNAEVGPLSVGPGGNPSLAQVRNKITPPNFLSFFLLNPVSGTCNASNSGVNPLFGAVGSGSGPGFAGQGVGGIISTTPAGVPIAGGPVQTNSHKASNGPWCFVAQVNARDKDGAAIPGFPNTGTAIYRVDITLSNTTASQVISAFVTVDFGGVGAGLSQSSAGPVEALSVRSTKVYPNPVMKGRSLQLSVNGYGIASTELKVYDLSGRTVLHRTAQGSTLSFSPLGDSGAPLANGVYLYIVTVRGFDGKAISSEVRKLVILR